MADESVGGAPSAPASQQIECPKCHKLLKSKQGLAGHLQQKHREDDRGKETQAAPGAAGAPAAGAKREPLIRVRGWDE